jgi:hypothetical protein
VFKKLEGSLKCWLTGVLHGFVLCWTCLGIGAEWLECIKLATYIILWLNSADLYYGLQASENSSSIYSHIPRT